VYQVIIVGGGLAGLSAAHTVLERGGRALVLDKKDFLGPTAYQTQTRRLPF
jgi:flavin-dependent dehydrogenase